MEANVSMSQLKFPDAALQPPAGPHIEAGLIQLGRGEPDVGGGGEIQRFQISTDRTEYFGIGVQHQHPVLMPSLKIYK